MPDSLEQRGRCGAGEHRSELARDGLDGPRLPGGFLIDPDGYGRQLTLQPAGEFFRQLTEVFDRQLVQAVLQRRLAHLPVDDEARGADGHGSDDDRCDPPVTDRIGGGAAFELVQVVVHPLARFNNLPFASPCRTAHPLFPSKLPTAPPGSASSGATWRTRLGPKPITGKPPTK